MKHYHLADEESYRIATLKRLRYRRLGIARELKRSSSTVSGELQRNAYGDSSYKAYHACRAYRGRRSCSRRGRRFKESDWQLVQGLIREAYSPEQISGRPKLEGNLCVSPETVCRHIWAEKKKGARLHLHLRSSGKRYGRRESRGSIEETSVIMPSRVSVIAASERTAPWRES